MRGRVLLTLPWPSQALSIHSGDSSVQASGLGALQELLTLSGAARQRAPGVGVLDAALAALRSSSATHAAVLERALGVLSALLLADDGGDDGGSYDGCAAGSTRAWQRTAVLEALTTLLQQKQQRLPESALPRIFGLLRCLASADAAAAPDVAIAVVAAMRSAPSSAPIQAESCRTLHALAALLREADAIATATPLVPDDDFAAEGGASSDACDAEAAGPTRRAQQPLLHSGRAADAPAAEVRAVVSSPAAAASPAAASPPPAAALPRTPAEWLRERSRVEEIDREELAEIRRHERLFAADIGDSFFEQGEGSSPDSPGYLADSDELAQDDVAMYGSDEDGEEEQLSVGARRQLLRSQRRWFDEDRHSAPRRQRPVGADDGGGNGTIRGEQGVGARQPRKSAAQQRGGSAGNGSSPSHQQK